jgi:hypothetical protein
MQPDNREMVERRKFKSNGFSKEECIATLDEFAEREKNNFIMPTNLSWGPHITEENSWKADCFGVGEMVLMDGKAAIAMRDEKFIFSRGIRAEPWFGGPVDNKPVRSWEESRALYLKEEDNIDQYYRDKFSIEKYRSELRDDREEIEYLHKLRNGMEDLPDEED